MAKIRKGQISFTAGEVSPIIGVRNDLGKYDNALEECLNFIVSPYGAIYRRPGFEYIAPAKSNTVSSRLVPFEYSADETYILEFADGYMRVFTDRAQVLSLGTPYQISIPYADDEIADLRFTQSFNTLYIAHKDYEPRQVTRIAEDNWTLSVVEFDEPPYLDENVTAIELTPSGTTGSITITASSATFESTDVGRAIRFKAGPDSSDTITYTGTGSQTYYDIPFYPNTSDDVEVYLVATNGSKVLQSNPGQYSISNGQVVMVTAPSSSQSIIIQPVNTGSGEWGWMTITAYNSSTSVDADVVRDLGGTNSSSEWRLGAWSETTGYPKCVQLHEQRLWFGNTITQPQTFWASEIGVYTNFQPDNVLYKGGVDADTSLTFTLAGAETQEIQWIGSKGALLIGTSNGIYSVTGANGSAISAVDVFAKKEYDVGCAFKPVTDTQNELLFIDRNKRRIYALSYKFEIDGYDASDVTLLADHLGYESTIEQITYQDDSNILWGLRADGTLISCTYMRGQDVTGWAQHTVAGANAAVNSIAIITGTVYDELWIHITRTINAGSQNYIEVLQPKFYFDDKEDAKFLDSMLTYSGAAASTISGLSHLEGETVSVLTNGSVHPDVIVTGGQITLNYTTTKAQVGLGYTSQALTMDLSGGSVIGSSQGAIARINEFSIRFFETLGANIGYDSLTADVINFRSAGDPMDSSPPLFSGYKKGTFPKGWNNDYKVFISQSQPLPMTILGVIVTANVADN